MCSDLWNSVKVLLRCQRYGQMLNVLPVYTFIFLFYVTALPMFHWLLFNNFIVTFVFTIVLLQKRVSWLCVLSVLSSWILPLFYIVFSWFHVMSVVHMVMNLFFHRITFTFLYKFCIFMYIYLYVCLSVRSHTDWETILQHFSDLNSAW